MPEETVNLEVSAAFVQWLRHLHSVRLVNSSSWSGLLDNGVPEHIAQGVARELAVLLSDRLALLWSELSSNEDNSPQFLAKAFHHAGILEGSIATLLCLSDSLQEQSQNQG